jgi:hypothetical protein
MTVILFFEEFRTKKNKFENLEFQRPDQIGMIFQMEQL